MEEEEELHHKVHRQHAIPQHIGAFQFKLVGAFTLRQFAYFGGFGFLAWLILASKLFPLIKFPLAAVFATVGVGFAFIPVSGQPLDKMLLAFFKSITSPTQRVWIKKGGLPEFFEPSFGKPQTVAPVAKTVASRKILKEYLSQFVAKPAAVDVAEEAFILKLDFGVSLPAKVALAVKEVAKAEPKTEIETLAGITVEERKPVKEAVVPIAASVNFIERPVITVPSPIAGPAAILTPIGEVKVRKLKSRPDLSGEFFLKVSGEKKFEVSPELRARLGLAPEKPTTEKALIEIKEAGVAKHLPKAKARVEEGKVKRKSKNGKTTTAAEFSQTKVIPPPAVPVPSQPNLIAGIVKDSTRHLLEGVILIVKNENGSPVRALKTNLLGQFSISTPLPDGTYTIYPEKEGYKFSIIEFEAKGEIVQPIEVVAGG